MKSDKSEETKTFVYKQYLVSSQSERQNILSIKDLFRLYKFFTNAIAKKADFKKLKKHTHTLKKQWLITNFVPFKKRSNFAYLKSTSCLKKATKHLWVSQFNKIKKLFSFFKYVMKYK